jgi:ATP-dependent exoDNAse (exonuclease V) beta subunit
VAEFILLKASAGSGKTYRLAERYLSFLLNPPADSPVKQDLANILAITFTNNAAREMKDRILSWLKECALGDERRIRHLADALGLPAEGLPALAAEAVERVLSGYTEFQVATIDSFVAAVFKASAVEMSTSPDFDIVLDHAELVEYAFSRFLRGVLPGTPSVRMFERILEDLNRYQKSEAGYFWDPVPAVRDKLVGFYGRLMARTGDVADRRYDKDRAKVQKALASAAEDLEAEIAAADLPRNERSTYWTWGVAAAIRENRATDLIGLSFKTPPVKRPSSRGGLEAYERVEAKRDRLRRALLRHHAIYARDFFSPYLEVYRGFRESLAAAQRRQGVVFLSDITRRLAEYLDKGVVPDIYLRLGDRIFHFLIDEFQDTSPVQWADLRPLVEESLSRGGSLFCVGDTKQAIYGFRNADYEIMRRLERREERFGPAEVEVRELPTNWRSRKAVVDFAKRLFLQLGEDGNVEEGIPPAPEDIREKYARQAGLSGLDDFSQRFNPAFAEPGYVEYTVFEKTGGKKGDRRRTGEEELDSDGEGGGAEAPADEDRPEKAEVQRLVKSLIARGYSPEEIAVLTYKNETVSEVASWLNEIKVPFVPFSSLDIRLRPVVREILSLLRFLDSPPDDLSFATFLLGEILEARLGRNKPSPPPAGPPAGTEAFREFLFQCHRRKVAPLYPAFRESFPAVWDRYFEPAFRSVGYFPLYDLVTLLYRLFGVHDLFPQEEAALAKLLEAVKDFEGRGRNDIVEFLALSGAAAEGSAWTIDVPLEIPAVRVMSIHKAKGLGFPVVLLLLYGQKRMAPDFYLDETADGIGVFKITKPLAKDDPELARVYEAQEDKDRVGLLNLLYVGCTRAKAELYVLGVKGGREYPFDLIEASLPDGRGDVRRPGEPVFRSDPDGPGPAVREKEGAVSPKAALLRREEVFIPPPVAQKSLPDDRVRRGEIAHRILSRIETVAAGGWPSAVEAAVASLAPAEPEAELFVEVGRTIASAGAGSPLGELFVRKPGRRILREFDFCDAEGRVFRMDRVVVDPEVVTVVDFKTGGGPDSDRDPEAGDDGRSQVRTYAAILRDVFPGRGIRANLFHLDRRSSEEVV